MGSSSTRVSSGKVALITGAASGQGRAAAQLFAEHGAAIVVVDVNHEGVHETVERIEKDGGRATALHADVSRRRDCDAMVAAAVDVRPARRALQQRRDPDVGTARRHDRGDVGRHDRDQPLGDLLGVPRRDPPHARRRRRLDHQHGVDARPQGRKATRIGAPRPAIALTRQIAVEYGPAVRANVIAPGSIDTPFRR